MKFNCLEDTEFVIFDVETTGLNPKGGDRILEVAALRVKDGKRIAQFSSLVNPKRPVSPAAFAINGISDEMVKDAPESKKVLPKFLDFIKGACLAAYNTSFDLGFINNEIEPLGLSLPANSPIIDILIMSRRLLPELNKYSLWYVAQSFGIEDVQEHRALKDVMLTAEVFRRLSSILKEKKINDFNSFFNLFGLNTHINDSVAQQKISSIQRAIDLKMRIKIRYFSSSKAIVSEREISPKELKEERGKNILVGFCHLRNEERSFRIDRILHLEML